MSVKKKIIELLEGAYDCYMQEAVDEWTMHNSEASRICETKAKAFDELAEMIKHDYRTVKIWAKSYKNESRRY